MKPFSLLFDLVVGLPAAVLKDAATLAGVITDAPESYTSQQCKKLDQDLKPECVEPGHE